MYPVSKGLHLDVHAANVWALCLVRGPFSCRPVPNPNRSGSQQNKSVCDGGAHSAAAHLAARAKSSCARINGFRLLIEVCTWKRRTHATRWCSPRCRTCSTSPRGPPSMCLSDGFSPKVSLSPTASPTVSLPRCLSHGVSPTVSLPRCLPHGVSPTVSFPRCLSHGVSPTVSLPRRLSHGVFPTVSLPRCLSHRVCCVPPQRRGSRRWTWARPGRRCTPSTRRRTR
jgi:hypothetical protein